MRKFTEKSANCTEKSEVLMLSKYASVGSRPFLYVKGFWPPAYFSFESIRHTCAEMSYKSFNPQFSARDKFYQRRLYFSS